MLHREKSNRGSLIVDNATSGDRRHACAQAAPAGPDDVRKYIAAMAGELAELAYRSGLDGLASACDVAREVAEGNVRSRTRHVEYRRGDVAGANAGQRDVVAAQRAGR